MIDKLTETCGEGPTTKNSNTYILSPSNVQKESEVFTVNCLIHEGKPRRSSFVMSFAGEGLSLLASQTREQVNNKLKIWERYSNQIFRELADERENIWSTSLVDPRVERSCLNCKVWFIWTSWTVVEQDRTF